MVKKVKFVWVKK